MLAMNIKQTWPESLTALILLLQVWGLRCFRRHPWKLSMTPCATRSQRAPSPPGCSAADSWREESTRARWECAKFPTGKKSKRFTHLCNCHALTSKSNLMILLAHMRRSPGRLWRPPVLFWGEREVVSGWHCELGWGLRPSEQARSLYPRHHTQRMDQWGDKNLMKLRSRGREQSAKNAGDETF